MVGMVEWREWRRMAEWQKWLHTYYLRYTPTDTDGHRHRRTPTDTDTDGHRRTPTFKSFFYPEALTPSVAWGSTMFLICPATNFLVDKNSVMYGLHTKIVPQEGCMVQGY